ncbi:histone-lysine N-methyltransferase ATXR3-like isoform X1 [Musa acuminata AAA Group]|uniref:histone-lysine N-methyltransferase ATXR3-like isoform X1 n=1 Tax=Musa acuminata AAA Group TaxID=214697 RepID=UPI0031D0A4E7
MGEGGVACAPSQHIMERFPIPESLCGGKGVLASNPFGAEKKTRNGERGDEVKREDELGAEIGLELDRRAKKGELEKGELERHRKGELEEGELHNGELEKGELRNGEFEKGESAPKKWRKSEVEVGDRRRRDEAEKGEIISDRRNRRELERGEFVPDKWKRWQDLEKSQNQSTRGRRVDSEKGDVTERSLKNSQQSSLEDSHRRNDRRPCDSDQRKRSSSSRLDGNVHERDAKKSLRVSEVEPGEIKHDNSNGRSRDREGKVGRWHKWQAIESESSNHKHHFDLSDQSGSRTHRKSEEIGRSTNPERSHRNESSSTSKVPSSSRYSSSRYDDPSFSSRGSHDRQGRSPGHSERSPKERSHHADHRDRSPRRLERSPHEKSHHSDHRDHTPSRFNRSPRQRARHHDHRDRTPAHLERSPHDKRHSADHRESNKKSQGSEKQQSSRHDERLGRKEYSEKDFLKNKPSRSSCDRSTIDRLDKEKRFQSSSRHSSETPPPPPPPVLPPPPLLPAPPPPPSPPLGVIEEPSMEEDMDISDTPPRDPITSDFDAGKWFYLDHCGIEQGPSKLVDLRRLVDEGVLLSDHLIKHADSDRWVTVENAASPLVPLNLPSIVSDVVTQTASPPEAPGNLLVDAGIICQETSSSMLLQKEAVKGQSPVIAECLEDYHIDERVETLLGGYTIVGGKELEIIGEALNTTFEHADWEKWGQSEGFSRFKAQTPSIYPREEGFGGVFKGFSTESSEIKPVFATSGKDYAGPSGGSSDWFVGRWSCKGGDWKRNDEVGQDKSYRRKLVINESYPLCQMSKSGHEDPRWHRKDDLYYPSRSKRLDLPLWAFSSIDDNTDSTSDPSKSAVASRSAQTKPLSLRGVKGTILPVVRINACVVKDQGSIEPHLKVKTSERHVSKSSRSHSSSDRNSLHEGSSRSRKLHEHDFQSLQRCRTILNIPKDHICTIDELSVDLGDWFYLDGAGYEHGPLSYLELQELVGKGAILEQSSVFRKNDNTWLPITMKLKSSEAVNSEEEARTSTARFSSSSLVQLSCNNMSTASHSFHSLYPQFIGYTRGKLHELVMRSYKNREFAAVISEVLDPWINAKQPKKEMDKHFPFNSSITKSSAVLSHDLSVSNIWNSEDGIYREGKRSRFLVDESDEDSEMEDALLSNEKNDWSFEDLCGEADIFQDNATSQTENGSWGLLNGHILARVFHFLKGDMKSLLSSATTCKHWNASVNFYRSICRHVDLSSVGPKCTDTVLQSLMGGYGKKNLMSLVLKGCFNVSAGVLEGILQLFPHIANVDIRGCNQFKELQFRYPNINWIKRSSSFGAKNQEESYSKTRSLKQITENNYLISRTYRSLSGCLDDSGDLENFGISESNSIDRKDFSSLQFKQGFYKRPKLLDARKSSELLSRDAQMRHWLHRKSENSYKKMEEFIANSLKDIVKGKKSDFFMPKIAKIEDRMRCGYYVRRGLSSVKDDISRMCRDAFKSKSQGDAVDRRKIIMSFIQLVKRLENPRLIIQGDELIKAVKDGSEAGSYFSESKYKKKQSKVLSEKKSINRGINTSYANGGTDYRAYAFDREIKRSLSKLKKREMDSDSETSEDDGNDFSEDDRGEDESTASDTESDLEIHSGSGMWDLKGEMDESSESVVTDDREWGARMTKASLVPPVTRKYEVIDKYLIVADEEEVQRKMQVALPDDYSEKLLAQKSGIEESDMEIPEVKDYKPRKKLGVEVLEQEVYGIDPYTHNLLLDSMPEEPDWPLADRHKFIEESLLRTLNKQVRHFTGTGNTPMVYPLQPVIEEVLKNAEEVGDRQAIKMCQGILKAMRSRPDDNYVAYRKGLGVVCNKQEGFEQDDFVVEFLGEVYPAWKWFEKQDGIRALQKNSQDPAPEFYNIYLERPKGDSDGYDLVVVDAMHKANYASRICHSCRPNCEAKVTAVDGQYQIGIYSLLPIGYGEEITFDYNSVTESKEEYEASVCLCGSQVCRGSYLNLSGEGAFEKVLKDCHGVLDRHKLILEACEANFVSQDDYIDLGRAGLGTCLLAGLPDWLVAYSAHLVRFINFERTKLPDEILRHNLEEKRKFFSDICLEVEKNDAEVQAEGVYNARLQNIALTLDKVRYVMRCMFGDPKKAPPPVEKLTAEGVVSVLWKGEGSLVEDLLHSMAPHVEADLLSDLKSKIQAHDPSGSSNIQTELRKSLLWLRDELRNLPCTYKCRHDAAADLIHIYAYTKVFFKIREYKSFKSPPVYISPLDLGPKYADKMGSGFQEYCKTYGENYCLGQLIYWYSQMNADPDCRLARACKGCLSPPDISSFYAKSQKPLREHVYGPRTMRFMLSRMEKEPQRPWPKDRIWLFKSNPKIFGSPMLDAVLNKCPLDKEMMHWLKTRPSVFQGSWEG